MDYVTYPCGCSASKGSPTYCPTHMTAMPLIREYAQFMYEAGYANERPDGDYSTEAADFERRIAALAAQQPAPADAEDMKVYKAISDNYLNSVAAQKVEPYQGPKKFAPEEIADGNRGIRWVTETEVCGRPTDHDVREYLLRTPTAKGCHCEECKAFYRQQPAPAAQPLSTEAKHAMLIEANKGYHIEQESYFQGIEDAEAHYGIGKEQKHD